MHATHRPDPKLDDSALCAAASFEWYPHHPLTCQVVVRFGGPAKRPAISVKKRYVVPAELLIGVHGPLPAIAA